VPEAGAQRKFYIGPSLYDADTPPLVVTLDEDWSRRLEGGDPYVWAGVLAGLQEFIDDAP
jgi:hypothetical protein